MGVCAALQIQRGFGRREYRDLAKSGNASAPMMLTTDALGAFQGEVAFFTTAVGREGWEGIRWAALRSQVTQSDRFITLASQLTKSERFIGVILGPKQEITEYRTWQH
jgi:hypothetical protein